MSEPDRAVQWGRKMQTATQFELRQGREDGREGKKCGNKQKKASQRGPKELTPPTHQTSATTEAQQEGAHKPGGGGERETDALHSHTDAARQVQLPLGPGGPRSFPGRRFCPLFLRQGLLSQAYFQSPGGSPRAAGEKRAWVGRRATAERRSDQTNPLSGGARNKEAAGEHEQPRGQPEGSPARPGEPPPLLPPTSCTSGSAPKPHLGKKWRLAAPGAPPRLHLGKSQGAGAQAWGRGLGPPKKAGETHVGPLGPAASLLSWAAPSKQPSRAGAGSPVGRLVLSWFATGGGGDAC